MAKASVEELASLKIGVRSVSKSAAQTVHEAAKRSVGLTEAADLHAMQLQSLLRTLGFQESEKAKFEDWIEDNVEHQALAVLTSYPGCSTTTAVAIIAELRDPKRFSKADKVVAYAGINPREVSSGTAGKKKKKDAPSWVMSKQGNRRLRRAIFMVTLSAVQCEPGLKAYYERKKARKKPMVALGHCMRKVLVTLWTLWKKQEFYDAAKVGVQTRG